MSRNNGVPPAPPTLGITSTTGSTISLGWTPAPDGGAPLIAYHVHYHREFGDWDRMDVSPRNTSFTLTGLRCGTNYQFYLQVPKKILTNAINWNSKSCRCKKDFNNRFWNSKKAEKKRLPVGFYFPKMLLVIFIVIFSVIVVIVTKSLIFLKDLF